MIAQHGRYHRGDSGPVAGAALDLEAAAERLDAVAQAVETAAHGLVCAADAVVDDLDAQDGRRPSRADGDQRGRGRSAGRWSPPRRGRSTPSPRRCRRAARRAARAIATGTDDRSATLLIARREAEVGERGRVDAVGELAQLLDRERDLGAGLLEQRRASSGTAPGVLARRVPGGRRARSGAAGRRRGGCARAAAARCRRPRRAARATRAGRPANASRSVTTATRNSVDSAATAM